MEALKNYSRQVKANLIRQYCQGKTIIDFGSGRLGPLHQFEKVGIESLLGIEPNQDHIQDAKSRLSRKPADFQSRFQFLACGMQDTREILLYFGEHGLYKKQIALSFFSLTFMFQSRSLFDSFLVTLDKTVCRNGGMFIGTVFDGDAVSKFLESEGGQIKTTDFQLERKQDEGAKGDEVFGKEIFIDMKDTIVDAQKEYLVDFETLVKGVENIGFKLVESKMFDPDKQEFPPDSQVLELSRMNRYFIFARYDNK